MNSLSYDDKVMLIKKLNKKNPITMELSLVNYERFNIYICLNEIDKDKVYRLSWYDLDEIYDKNVEKYMSCQYIDGKVVDAIRKFYLDIDIDYSNFNNESSDSDLVAFYADIKTKCSNEMNVIFNKYLPISLSRLDELFIFIFKNMPKKFDVFLYEIMAMLTDSVEKYEYKKEFDFDLFNDDIDSLFDMQIIDRGKKYYEEEKILFLEKIDNRYFAVVEGTDKYIVVIKYIEENKKMQVYCSCPCEFYCKHIYAVLLGIRNNKMKRFYKIMYRNPNKDIMQRIAEFDYRLCLGLTDDNLEIINEYGEIQYVPILDAFNRCNWQVLEDDLDQYLTKQIKYYLDNL